MDYTVPLCLPNNYFSDLMHSKEPEVYQRIIMTSSVVPNDAYILMQLMYPAWPGQFLHIHVGINTMQRVCTSVLFIGRIDSVVLYFRLWAMPAFLLKRQILVNLPSDNLESEVANSIDFMVERVSRVT